MEQPNDLSVHKAGQTDSQASQPVASLEAPLTPPCPYATQALADLAQVARQVI